MPKDDEREQPPNETTWQPVAPAVGATDRANCDTARQTTASASAAGRAAIVTLLRARGPDGVGEANVLIGCSQRPRLGSCLASDACQGWGAQWASERPAGIEA
jgi:hypothetical protein